MSNHLKGYAGTYGNYKPSESCHVPPIPSLARIAAGNSIPKQWGKEVNVHIHVKNLVHSNDTPQGHYLTFGGFNVDHRYAVSLYHTVGKTILVVTSAKFNNGRAMYFGIEGANSGIDGERVSGDDFFVRARPIPSEYELWLRNEKLTIVADGKIYFDAVDISGNYSGTGGSFPSGCYIYGAPNVSFDLIDFTYESDGIRCRFVPMKTADGKDAIYEVYSKQVVEI